MNLSDQTVLISGGAGSIGSYLCEYYYGKAAKVILLDRDAEKLNSLKEQYRDIAVFAVDLTNGEDVASVTKQISQEYKVTVLVNNAGVIHSEPMINILNKENGHHDFAKWDMVIKANLYSAFYLTACMGEIMVKQRSKGVIISISSIAAQGNLGQSAYSAAKAGIEALTKTWSKELGMFKIRCVCIAPGFFNTPSTHTSLSEAVVTKWQKSVPLGKLGELADLAQATQFVIENDYFNGKILSLDGGLTI